MLRLCAGRLLNEEPCYGFASSPLKFQAAGCEEQMSHSLYPHLEARVPKSSRTSPERDYSQNGKGNLADIHISEGNSFSPVLSTSSFQSISMFDDRDMPRLL